MTPQYDFRRSNESSQKDTDNWILQRSAVRQPPAKTLTPQTESTAGDRSGMKLDLMQIPVSNYSANPSPLQALAQSARETPVQRQEEEKKAENKTGLPDRLKEGIESLSGYDLSGVRVNYNSPKPAQLNAHAYTQGQAIEVAPGQERHLPHESWHVVQQMQGRVRPTTEVNGVGVNGDRGLEREADVMGQRAIMPVQAKLTISQAGDKYEQEADRVASQVVNRINAPVQSLTIKHQSIQAQDEQNELIVQRQVDKPDLAITSASKSKTIQRNGRKRRRTTSSLKSPRTDEISFAEWVSSMVQGDAKEIIDAKADLHKKVAVARSGNIKTGEIGPAFTNITPDKITDVPGIGATSRGRFEVQNLESYIDHVKEQYGERNNP